MGDSFHIRNGVIWGGIIWLLVGCTGDDNISISQGNHGVSILIVKGNAQEAAPGEAFTIPLEVSVQSAATGTGVPDAIISFTENSTSGSVILPTSQSTDSNGHAAAVVRAATVQSQAIQIVATIEGSSQSVTFNLQIVSSQASSHFVVTTTHGGRETAGIPFGIVVQIQDQNGNVFSNLNESEILNWTYISASSWGGMTPDLPSGEIDCEFVAGVCQMPGPYTIADSRTSTLISAGMNGGPSGVFNQPISVSAGVASSLKLANLSGGPGNGAVAYGANLTLSADQPVANFFAAITDSSGNYLSDGGSVTWTGDAQVVGPHLTAIAPNGVTLDAIISGSGSLDASVASLSTTLPVSVTAGIPDHLSVTTQDGSTNETPGKPFELLISAVDSHGNTATSYNGTFAVTAFLTTNGTAFLSNGCNRFYVPANGDSYWSGSCLNTGRLLSFVNGVAAPEIEMILNVAGAASSVSVSTAAQGSFPALTGLISSIPISIGTPDHVMASLRSGATPPGPLCSTQNLNNSSLLCTALTLVLSENPSLVIYATVEDRGGNFIANVPLDPTIGGSWTAGEFTAPMGYTLANALSLIFTPNATGNGSITLTDSALGLSSTFYGTVTP